MHTDECAKPQTVGLQPWGKGLRLESKVEAQAGTANATSFATRFGLDVFQHKYNARQRSSKSGGEQEIAGRASASVLP